MADLLVFKNVRLVCRLRKSSPARTPSGSVGPASALSSSQTAVATDDTPTSAIPELPDNTLEVADHPSGSDTPASISTPSNAPSKNRYFILKSLTKEDLAWSVANKLWATQPHNESILNEAFKVAFLSYEI